MLTSKQLDSLRQDLLDLACIKYDEVLAELLDHYASLTEQGMAENHSFEDACAKAWIQLGGGKGINHIQERYKKLLLNRIQRQHWAIVRRYFRWPTLVTTVLIGLLSYSIANVLAPGTVAWLFLVVVFAPYLLFIPSEFHLFWRKRIKKLVVLTSLKREVVYRQARYGNFLYLATVQTPVLIASFVMDDGQRFNRPFFFEWHVGLSAALTFVAAIYTITFIELYREQMPHRPVHS